MLTTEIQIKHTLLRLLTNCRDVAVHLNDVDTFIECNALMSCLISDEAPEERTETIAQALIVIEALFALMSEKVQGA